MDLDIRYATHPDDVRNYDTETLRRHFLIDSVFAADRAILAYSHVDRIIGPLPLYPVTPALPRGQHAFNCRMADVVTLEPRVEDLNTFQVQ